MNSQFSYQITHTLGWTLLHSVWQISLAALVLYLILTYSKKGAANFRYTTAINTLAVSIVLVMGTFAYLYFNYQPAPHIPSGQEPSLLIAHPFAPPAQSPGDLTLQLKENSDFPYFSFSYISQMVDAHASTITIIWLAGVILLSLKFLAEFAYTRRLKYHPKHVFQDDWQRKAQKLAIRIGIDKKIQVVASTIAKAPMVIGHLKPIIIVPAALLAGLPPEQMEAVLAHELAHIYRKDYWINMLQTWAEIILFYHPALWWISSVIRTERENCCDDLAVAVCGSTMTYAKALAQVEESRQQMAALAMAANGKQGYLLQRIERLLHPHSRQPQIANKYASALVMLLIVGTAGTGMAFKAYETPLHDTLAQIFHMPQINSQDQAGAKTAAKATEGFYKSGVQRESEKQLIRTSPKKDPCLYQLSSSQPCENEVSKDIIVQKAVQTDTIPPLALKEEEDLDLMLNLDLDSLWNIDVNLDLDLDPAVDVDLDTVPGSYLFNFSGGDTAFHFQFNVPDAPGAILNWHMGPAPFDADTLFPPHAFHLSDSMMQLYLRPLDSLRMRQFQMRDSLIQRRIAKEMERTEKLMQRLHSKQLDSARIFELHNLQSQIQAHLEQNEEALRAQSEALARQAEILKKKAEEFERRAEELEAKAKEKEKEKDKNKTHVKKNNFDQSTMALEKELLKDGLIKKGEQYTFEIKQNQLKVNGKKQSQKTYKKYANLLNNLMNVSLEKGRNFSLTKKPFE